MPKLPPFRDADLHPQILEALKRLEVAKDAYDSATASLDAQYLKALDQSPAAKQAEAVRARF